MSYNNGPKTVTDGLTLHLDVANPKSYPGSGTTWTDLAQGLSLSAAGTTTPVEIKGGATSFAFNSSGYWYTPSGYERVDMGGDCTLLMWIYNEGLATRRTVFEKSGTSYSSYQQEIAVTWEVENTLSWYSRYTPNYDWGVSTAFPVGSWYLMGIKMSTGKFTTARTGFHSKNGSPWVQGYTSNSNTAVLASGGVVIGGGYAGVCDTGNIASVLVYNKMLTDAEVLQNFNATKRRFGL